MTGERFVSLVPSARCRLLFASVACAALALALSPATTQAQSLRVGPNVNIVSGTRLPDGDPWLQRQNEPSLAVSTRNPCHLLAGANDYRTVDMPGLPEAKETGDAWLGLFKSFDCGRTWKSGLVPGYPQDASQAAASSPLKGLQAGADPIVRAGTNGLFFYSGIVFNRGAQAASKVFVARFVDNNDQTIEQKEDSIAYLGASVVDTGTTGQFTDKPYVVVDVPRAGKKSATCTINGQTIAAGNVYVAWSRFVGELANNVTKLMVATSSDCGVTWDHPVKISEGVRTNQGATMAIDPESGAVYVAWRQFASPFGQDAILVAKSTDSGQKFSKPATIAAIAPFDQNTSGAGFRTNAYPTMAIDGGGRVFVAWSQRGVGPGGDARIVVAKSTDGGANWSAPAAVDDVPSRGHQIMPAMTIAGGKLQIVYYDLRDDHTFLTYEVNPAEADALTWPYKKTRKYAGDLSDPTPTASQWARVFWDYVADTPPPGTTEPLVRRHTIDVQAAQADLANPALTFATARVSQYALGTWAPSDDGTLPPIVQMQFNPPNLPLYAQGASPFVGDYVDVAALSFVRDSAGTWKFNTNSTSMPPVFHAVWTDNRDVSPPPEGSDWTKYTAPKGGATCMPGTTGMRDSNIYTAAILPPLVVGSLDNSKRLNGTTPRAFPVFVQNTTTSTKHYLLTVADPPGGTASFTEFDAVAVHQIYVTLPAMSGAARTVYVTSSQYNAQVTVDVREVTDVGGTIVAGGDRGAVLLNPDPLGPAIMNPAIMNDSFNPAIMNRTITNPAIMNPAIMNPAIMNPAIMNPADPAWALINPAIMNPAIMNPAIMNPAIMNPAIMNPAVMNPAIMNPAIMNPAIMNPAIMNTLPSDAIITDTTWTVRNDGNAAASYSIKLTGTKQPPSLNGYYSQLILHKRYVTPGPATVVTSDPNADQSAACALGLHTDDVVLANIPNPQIVSQPGGISVNDPAIMNATMALAPGEEGFVTLRIVDPNRLDNVVTYDPGSGRYYSYDPIFDTTKDVVLDPIPQPVNEPPLPTGTSLSFSTEPSATLAGQPMTPAVRVSVSPAPATPARVTVALAGNGNSGILSGTLSADTNPGGVATFSDLSVSTVGTGYQLLASVPGSGSVLSGPFNVTGGGPVTITTAALPHNTLRDPYNATIQTSGGTGSKTFAISAGALPPGVTLNSTGTLSGTPTTAGDFSFTVRVADSSVPPLFVTQSYALRIFAVDQNDQSILPSPPIPGVYVVLAQFGGGGQRLAQIFTNNVFGLLGGVRLAMSCQGGGTATATAAIYGVDSAGQIYGSPLSSGSMSIPTGPHVNGYRYLIPLLTPVPVGPGQRMAMVLDADKSCSIEQGAYSFGDGFWNNGGGWTYLENDLTFETLVTPPDSMRYSLNEHHAENKAIALANGRILILPRFPFVAAETYDPITHAFAAAGSLTTARANYTATLLADGRVLVAGGVVSGTSSTTAAEIFDPVAGVSTPTTGPLNHSRGDHTATLLPDHTVLIAGGHSLSGGVYADVLTAEIFDPATSTFSDVASPMGGGRHSHTATLLANGHEVLIAGGNPQTGPTPTAEIYDTLTRTFVGTYLHMTNGMIWQRAEHTATLLDDGRVLLAGGASVYGTLVPEAEVFDPATRTFSAAGTLLAPRLWHTATRLADGTVLIVGGRTSYTGDDMGLASVERWSPATGRFAPAGHLLIGRMSPATAHLADDSVFVVGGDGSSRLAFWVAEQFGPGVSDLLLTITPAVLPVGSVGVPYAAVTLGATGGSGPYAFNVTSGNLPPGLTLAGDLITGTATQPGSWVFTVEVRDTAGPVSYYTLSIRIDPLTITTTVLPVGVLGVPYSATLAATGTGSITWTIEGTLPGGLILDGATGVISGTPNTVGPHAFFVIAHDSSGHRATRELGVQIAVAGTPDTLAFTTVPTRAVGGQAFAVDVSAHSGGIAVPGAAVTLGFSNNPGGSPALGLTAFADALGIAHFPSVVISRGGYGYSLLASSGGISSSPSNQFDVIGFAPTGSGGGFGGQAVARLPNGKVLLAGGDAYTVTAQLYDPAVGTFSAIGSMSVPRNYATATLLPNGKVLVAGGYTGAAYTKTAELYDPALGTFAYTGTMTYEHGNHTATLLPNGTVLVAGDTTTAEVYDPATGLFTAASGPMNANRIDHTATLLANGKVLMAGGESPGGTLASAEIYDPTTGSFTSTGTMHVARARHSATMLPNGHVLIAGGQTYSDGPTFDSAEVYDPAAGTFTSTGGMASSHSDHAAVALPSGRVLVASGISARNGSTVDTTSVAELYDPVSGTFETTGPTILPWRDTATLLGNGLVLITGGGAMAELYYPADPPYPTAGFESGGNLLTARRGHTATQLSDGRILVAGGRNAAGTILNTAEVYDPIAGTSAPVTGTTSRARTEHTATLLPNGKVLLIGGRYSDDPIYPYSSSADLYDPVANTLSPTGVMSSSRPITHTATLLPNGKVLVVGGISRDTAELYDPGTGLFSGAFSYAGQRYGHSATLLPNGKVFIVGGEAYPLGELFDPATNTFAPITASPNAAHAYHTATLLPNGTVLIAGGVDAIPDAEVYDPGANSFAATGNLTQRRTGHVAASISPSGRVVILGGSTPFPWSPVATGEMYDPRTGTFTALGTMSAARDGAAAILLGINGKVIILGGWDGSTTFATTELYRPR